MGVVIPVIRGDNYYCAFAPETSPGTPSAPIYFPRWLNGTSIEIDMKTQKIKEGDGSRRTILLIKNGQKVKIKLVSLLRPIELGALTSAAMGASSDAYSAPAVATTLAAATLANATSATVHANTGLTGSGTINLVLEAGTATEEVATFVIPATGGSDPFTLAVDSSYNGGHLKFAHANSGTVKSVATHVITDQSDGGYFTFECGFGNLYGAAGTALRVRSCKIASMKAGAKSGEFVKYEIEVIGIASTVQGSAATITLEQHQPFMFTGSTWTIDGATTGDAPDLESFEIEVKNNPDETQTEALTLAALSFGDLDVTAKYTIAWLTASKIFQTYFGSSSGTTDAIPIGLGSLNVLFSQPDGFHTLQYNILTLGYLKAQPPVPKEDGKHFTQDVEGESVPVPLLGSGANNPYLLQTTITNTKYAAY